MLATPSPALTQISPSCRYQILLNHNLTEAKNCKTGYIEYSSLNASSVFQFALNRLGTTQVANNIYNLTNYIILPSNSGLIGSGLNTVLNYIGMSSNQQLLSIGLKNIYVSHLVLNGNGKIDSVLDQASTTQHYVSNLTVSDVTAYCGYQYCFAGNYQNSKFSGLRLYGFEGMTASTMDVSLINVKILNSYFYNAFQSSGLYVSAINSTISGSWAINDRNGFSASETTQESILNLTYNNDHALNFTNAGWVVGANSVGATPHPISNISVRNSTSISTIPYSSALVVGGVWDGGYSLKNFKWTDGILSAPTDIFLQSGFNASNSIVISLGN